MMRVRCQICNLSRTHEKYARHLAFHVANREISSSAMKGILFQSKYSRKDKSVKKFNLSNGHTCGICGNIVQDLTRHLTKIHQIDSPSVKFSKLKDVSETCQRANHYKVTKQANVNPLFDYSKLSPVLIPKMLPDVIQNTTTSIPVLKSIFDYSDSEETQTDDFPNPSDEFNINRLESHISKDLLQATSDFRKFLATKWGGSKPPRCIQMETSNICRMINRTGSRMFFNPHAINSILSEESKSGKTLITIHSRVKSYERFILFLKSVDSALLPKTQELDQLSFMIGGVSKSLLRERNNRQKIVMSNNRKRYNHAAEVLQMWREKRHLNSIIDSFDDFSSQPDALLTKEKFRRFRDFLITEILLSNGQRSGVISGMLVEEILEGVKHITPEGHHKIMVSNHKTGTQQLAALFIYNNIFQKLLIFVKDVLPRVVLKNQVPSIHVFQTFSGNPITSCVVTQIVRSGLLDLRVTYLGTVNDFRRAAATLTGKFNPNLSEKMALFMGHSRRVHDKHYRVQLGHDGLVDAFNTLEKMQTTPFSEQLPKPVDVISQFNQDIQSSLNISDNSATLHNNRDLNHEQQISRDLLDSDQSSLNPNSIVSSPLLVGEYEDIVNSSQYSIGQNAPPILKLHHLAIPVSPIFTSNLLSHSTNDMQHLTDSNSLPEFVISYPSSEVELSHSDVDPITLSSNFEISGKPSVLKECQVVIQPISPNILSRKSSYFLRRRLIKNIPVEMRCNSIFAFPEDELIFFSVFKSYIHMVKEQSRVSKSEVTQRAKTSTRFSPVLDRLLSLNSGDIYQKLYNRIRTLGVQLRMGNSELFGKTPSIESQIENDPMSTSCMVPRHAHHRSIFQFQHEEDIFFEVFCDLIKLVKSRQFVSQKMIIDRLYESKEFSPVLNELLKIHSSNQIEKIIINKTRSSAYNLQKNNV